MPPQPQDQYNPVPTVSPNTSTGNDYLAVRATPQSMGSDVGDSLQRAGATVGELGKQTMDFARFEQGLVNDTLVTKADADFATRVGVIKGKYTSLTGLSAYNAFPQYQEDIKSAFNETRGTLPLTAQRSFDRMAARSMANHVADGSGYASSQLKEAQRDSYANLANVNMTQLLDPDVAKDPARSGEALGNIKYAAQAVVDHEHPGLKTDPETGITSFDESTPEGQSLKMTVDQRTQTWLTQGYVNRYKTLMQTDLFGAYNEYEKDRDSMPPGARVVLDATFKPKIFDAHVNGATGNTVQEAFQDHWKMLTAPPQEASKNAIDWTIDHEGGYVSNDSGKGPTNFGINQESNPGVNVQNLTRDQAAKIMHDKYWMGVGADKMQPTMGAVAFDTAVNMGVDKAKTLVAQAGGDPQKLIDLRREEYQRLATANPERYGQYLEGWNKRLDDLQQNIGQSQKPSGLKTTYGTGENGAPLSIADYYMLHKQDVLMKGDVYAESMMPGDLALKRAVRQSLSNFMETTISNQHAQISMDNRQVMRAVNGELTNGKVPGTELELRQIPGMSDLLDKVAYQDPKFSETIPTLVAKSSSRHSTVNSPNGYDTMIRSLQPNDGLHPNGIFSQDHLARLMGRSDGTGINMKDYKEAKEAIDLPDKFKSFLTKNMQDIANANGNVDGMGQQRAINYYNSVIELYQKKTQDGKTVANMTNPESSDYINLHGDFMPSRASQLATAAERNRNTPMQTFNSPTDPAFLALPAGTQFMVPGESTPRVKK